MECSQRKSVSSVEEFVNFYSIISYSPLSMKKFSHKGSFEDLSWLVILYFQLFSKYLTPTNTL